MREARAAPIDLSIPEEIDETVATLDTLFKQHGREKVLALSRAIREAPRNGRDLASPSSLGCRSTYPTACFFEALAPVPRTAQPSSPPNQTAESRYQQELAEWEKRITANPRDSAAYYQLGTLHMVQGNSAEAVKAFEAYLKLEPKGPVADSLRKYIASQRR